MMTAHQTPRRGDRTNPHQGDCTGTRCPACDCCMHCAAVGGECSDCPGCHADACQCPQPAKDERSELDNLRTALGAALILLDRTERALRATITERDGWQRDAADHAAHATATGYRLNGALRERDRLAVRLAEVERERDALESLHDEWAEAIRELTGRVEIEESSA